MSDSFKIKFRRKSRTEMFADLLENLFIIIEDLGVDTVEVLTIVKNRIDSRAKLTAVNKQFWDAQRSKGKSSKENLPHVQSKT
jgi:hypothetical protein